MGKRKRIITFTVGVLIAVAIAAGLFYYFSLAPSRKPLPREVRKEQPLLSKIETVAKKKVTTAQPEEQKLPISGEQPEVKERKEPRREIAQPEYAYAYLAAEPKALSIEVEQGQRQQASFKLTNKGRKAAWLNLYKSELNEPPVAFGEKIEQYLTHKKEVIADKDPVAMLAKAGLSFGAPGIIIYPTYNVIESGQSQEIRLTVDARDLEADKEYTAQTAPCILYLPLNPGHLR